MNNEEAILCIKANVCYKQEVCSDGICKSTEDRPCAIDVAIESLSYDVDAVIEELNKEQELWLRGYNQTLSMGLEHLWRNLSGRAFGVARAIDIIKRGWIDANGDF